MSTPSPSSTTILIADDEAPIRLVVGEKLRSAGYTVVEARDGDEALEHALSCHPDAVITDLQMPYMNGLELATRLRQEPATANVPVLLLTARGHILAESELAQTNIQKVMSKPFGVRDLLAYVQDTLLPLSSRKAAPAAGQSTPRSEAA